METIQLELDAQILQQAQQIAQARQVSLEQLLSDMIEELAHRTVSDDPLWGLFADEVELIDDVVESVMLDREARHLRQAHG